MSTATSKVRTALVIGGGIAGPVAATALLKAGLQATVYEAYPTLAEGIGGGLALAPNGLAALGIIGADDAVRALATPITGTVMAVGGNTRRLPSLAGVEPLQVIGRGDLHRVLHDRAVESGVRFEYGKRLVAVDEAPDSVTARFDDGTAATADVLIGADGVRSTVRTLIDPEAPGAGYTGLLGFQGYVNASPDLDPEPGVMTFAFGQRAYYLFWKMADGRVTWGANLPSKQYMSLAEARAIPAGQWLQTLRDTYAGDLPGELLANRTTAENLDITGAIHIMPPVPALVPRSHGAGRRRRPRAVQQHRPGRVAGDRERHRAGAVPAGSARCHVGVPCLRAVAAGAGGEDHEAGRPDEQR